MTSRQPVKNKKNSSPKSAAMVAGAIGIVAATGAGGYIAGTSTVQDVQGFEPVYTVSKQNLKEAKTKLSSLEVRSDTANIPDYDSKTMPEWSRSNGCSTRYNLLAGKLESANADRASCKITSGTIFDYYTGSLLAYNRRTNGGGIDIDHIVAKGDAWESGGYAWSNDEWKTYINDSNVLIATSANINRSKGDKNAAEWLPPNEDYWCKYVTDQINIKSEYHLSVTADEKSTIERILATNCKKN